MKKMSRRQFLKGWGYLTAACTVTGTGLYQYGSRIEAAQPVVEQVQIPLTGLPAALDGFKLVQISDIHIDAYTEIGVVETAVSLTNSLKPDVIVLTGDYISYKAEAIEVLDPLLTSLKAKYGVFAILGNHDIWTNPTVIRERLGRMGLKVLVNEGLGLQIGSATLYLAGVDDCWSGQPDLAAALAKHPAEAPVILLAHEPDFADVFALDGRVALQLSGHSHGGQVRLPGHGAFILPAHGRKYDQGLYRVGGMWLYTNRGLGLAVVPFRLNCPPEVTEITLVRA